MQLPVEIAFRNMSHSPALETRAHALADRLEKFSPQIIHCRVVVQAPHRHRRHGKLYAVTIRMTVPGRELVIRHTGAADPAHEDPYVALRDAFKAVRRRLQDYERERRGDIKFHAGQPHKWRREAAETAKAPRIKRRPTAFTFVSESQLDSELEQTFPASDPLPSHRVD